MNSNVVVPIELQSVDVSTILVGSYKEFKLSGVEGALSIITFNNDSNVPVFISYNKLVDNEYVRAGESKQINFQASSSPSNNICKLKRHTIVYARGTAGIGTIYLSGYYSK